MSEQRTKLSQGHYCVFCGGDPEVRCRDGKVDPSGSRLEFVGNMTETLALARGYAVSGRVKIGERTPLFHAYREV